MTAQQFQITKLTFLTLWGTDFGSFLTPQDSVLDIQRRKQNVMSLLIKVYSGALSKRNNLSIMPQKQQAYCLSSYRGMDL